MVVPGNHSWQQGSQERDKVPAVALLTSHSQPLVSPSSDE